MSHPQRAKKFIEESGKVSWHDKALWFVREKRDRSSKNIPEWEKLRSYASEIKIIILYQIYTITFKSLKIVP